LREGIKSIFILNRNAYLLRSHLEKIEAVVNAPQDQRLEVFQTEFGKLAMSKVQQERFLELFARMTEDMTTWNELKAEVTDLAKNHENFKPLLEMMIDAEKSIKKYGYISKFYSASVHDYAVALMLRTPFAIAIVQNWPVISHWFAEVYIMSATSAVNGWQFLSDWGGQALNLLPAVGAG
jgi:hypothetical protein